MRRTLGRARDSRKSAAAADERGAARRRERTARSAGRGRRGAGAREDRRQPRPGEQPAGARPCCSPKWSAADATTRGSTAPPASAAATQPRRSGAEPAARRGRHPRLRSGRRRQGHGEGGPPLHEVRHRPCGRRPGAARHGRHGRPGHRRWAEPRRAAAGGQEEDVEDRDTGRAQQAQRHQPQRGGAYRPRRTRLPRGGRVLPVPAPGRAAGRHRERAGVRRPPVPRRVVEEPSGRRPHRPDRRAGHGEQAPLPGPVGPQEQRHRPAGRTARRERDASDARHARPEQDGHPDPAVARQTGVALADPVDAAPAAPHLPAQRSGGWIGGFHLAAAPLASKVLADAPVRCLSCARVPGAARTHRRPPPGRSPHEPPPRSPRGPRPGRPGACRRHDSSPAARAHRYFAPSTATGFSVVYG